MRRALTVILLAMAMSVISVPLVAWVGHCVFGFPSDPRGVRVPIMQGRCFERFLVWDSPVSTLIWQAEWEPAPADSRPPAWSLSPAIKQGRLRTVRRLGPVSFELGCGWPARCFRGHDRRSGLVRAFRVLGHSNTLTYPTRVAPYDVPTFNQSSVVLPSRGVLVYDPIWRGLAIDGVVHFAIWFVALFTFGLTTRLARAALRARRSRCPTCRYDVGSIPGTICPECGCDIEHWRAWRYLLLGEVRRAEE